MPGAVLVAVAGAGVTVGLVETVTGCPVGAGFAVMVGAAAGAGVAVTAGALPSAGNGFPTSISQRCPGSP